MLKQNLLKESYVQNIFAQPDMITISEILEFITLHSIGWSYICKDIYLFTRTINKGDNDCI